MPPTLLCPPHYNYSRNCRLSSYSVVVSFKVLTTWLKRLLTLYRVFYLRKRMSLDEARHALRLLLKLIERNVEIYLGVRYLEKAFAISAEYGITVYDALYIALAQDRKPLLTLDEKQRCVAKTLGIAVLP